jgi:hypothetical protein
LPFAAVDTHTDEPATRAMGVRMRVDLLFGFCHFLAIFTRQPRPQAGAVPSRARKKSPVCEVLFVSLLTVTPDIRIARGVHLVLAGDRVLLIWR